MGFFSAVKKIFGVSTEEKKVEESVDIPSQEELASSESTEASLENVQEAEEVEKTAEKEQSNKDNSEVSLETEAETSNTTSQTEAENLAEEAKQVEIQKVVEEIVEAKIQAEIEVEAQAEAKQEVEVETKTEVEAEVQAQIETETKVEAEVETKTEVQAEAEIEAEANTETETKAQAEIQTETEAQKNLSPEYQELILALRQTEPKLSAWLQIVLKDQEEVDERLWRRLSYLLQALETPQEEAELFLAEFKAWLKLMEYEYIDDFRSELQYRLALALDLEDEEDERDRLFLKVQTGLERTRNQLGKGLQSVFAGHDKLGEAFFEDLEELFIMSDMGAELSLKLVGKLREHARQNKLEKSKDLLPYLQEEVRELFKLPKKIQAINKPEVVLMVGVNGVGKTTTIAKLAYRAKMQGKKVLVAGADTFRAAAVEQLEEWSRRVGADFYSKGSGADPAAVAYEAMDKGLAGDYDIIFIDTAGRLHNKSNLMDELTKIRTVIGKKAQGAPHRSILVIDATTGQNALQQTKIFKENSGVDEIILTKLDGTAKGGVALSVANSFELPISFIGLGEKMEDLRPFHADDFAKALLGDLAE